MPIANIQDAREVERGLQTIFDASNPDDRARAIRTLFVETPDFHHVDRLVPLGVANDPDLPSDHLPRHSLLEMVDYIRERSR